MLPVDGWRGGGGGGVDSRDGRGTGGDEGGGGGGGGGDDSVGIVVGLSISVIAKDSIVVSVL